MQANLKTYNSALKVVLLMWRIVLMLVEELQDPDTRSLARSRALFRRV